MVSFKFERLQTQRKTIHHFYNVQLGKKEEKKKRKKKNRTSRLNYNPGRSNIRLWSDKMAGLHFII